MATNEIKVTIWLEVPESATIKDISDYVDVEYGQCNSRKIDNPCIDKSEIIEAGWEWA